MTRFQQILVYALACLAVAYVVVIIPGATMRFLSGDDTQGRPLAVGTNIWPGYEPFYVGREVGLLSPSTARLLEYSSTTQVLRSFTNGNIDVAALTLDEAIKLVAGGTPAKIVLVADASFGGDVILAKPGIPDMASLRGKRVAVESTALGAYVLSRALQIHGLSAGEVTIVPAEIDEHESFYRNDLADAFVTFSPVREKLLQAGLNEIFTSREIPGEIVDVFVVHPELLAERREALTRLLRSWMSAVRFIETHPQQAHDVMSVRLNVDPGEVPSMLEGLTIMGMEANSELLVGDEPTLRDVIRRLNRQMQEDGFIDRAVDPDSMIADLVGALQPDGARGTR